VIEREREHQQQAEDVTAFDELTTRAGNTVWRLSLQLPSLAHSLNGARRGGRLGRQRQEHRLSELYPQTNDTPEHQSDGTGDLTNGNFTEEHLIIGNVTWNSLLSNNTVNQSRWGTSMEQPDRQQYQRAAGYFSERVVRHKYQRSAAVLSEEVAIQRRLFLKRWSPHI